MSPEDHAVLGAWKQFLGFIHSRHGRSDTPSSRQIVAFHVIVSFPWGKSRLSHNRHSIRYDITFFARKQVEYVIIRDLQHPKIGCFYCLVAGS